MVDNEYDFKELISADAFVFFFYIIGSSIQQQSYVAIGVSAFLATVSNETKCNACSEDHTVSNAHTKRRNTEEENIAAKNAVRPRY